MSQLLQKIARYDRFVSRRSVLGPIGIEFSMEKIHMVQIGMRANGEKYLVGCASADYPTKRDAFLSEPGEMKATLRRLMKQNGFSGSSAVVAALPGMARIVPVTYQLGKDQADEDAIIKIMRNRIDGSLDEYVIDYLPIRSGGADDDRLAMVAFARKSDVIAFLERLRHSGLSITAMEVAPSAINRLITIISGEDPGSNILVVSTGYQISFMTMISGDRVLFDHKVNFGEADLLFELSEMLDMGQEEARDLIIKNGLFADEDPEKDGLVSRPDIAEGIREIVKPGFMKLVDEVNRSLIYAAAQTHGKSANRIYLLGVISRWPGVDRLLGRMANIAITIPDPLRTLTNENGPCSGGSVGSNTDMAIATGLALRGLDQHG